jgi:toxin ParE1/3/4
MPRIERTSRSRTDAVEIWSYVGEDNPDAADDLIDQIQCRLDSLSRMPLSAEAVPYIDANVRRSTVGNYVIYYRPLNDGIQVLRILHGARQPEDLI